MQISDFIWNAGALHPSSFDGWCKKNWDKYLLSFFLEIWKQKNSFISQAHAFGWNLHDSPSEMQLPKNHCSRFSFSTMLCSKLPISTWGWHPVTKVTRNPTHQVDVHVKLGGKYILTETTKRKIQTSAGCSHPSWLNQCLLLECVSWMLSSTRSISKCPRLFPCWLRLWRFVMLRFTISSVSAGWMSTPVSDIKGWKKWVRVAFCF